MSAMSQGPQCLMSVSGERSNSAIFMRSRIRSSMSRKDMWQPKQPASEVVAMRTFGKAAVSADALIGPPPPRSVLADRLKIIAALADRHGIADALDQDRADRADVRRLVRDREIRVAELAARRVDHDVRGHAAAGERKYGLAVHVVARANAELALDAAIEVDQHVRVRSVDRPVRVELDEMRRHHLAVVGERLQLTITALLAAGAEVVALDEQHLHQRAPIGVQVRRVDLDLLTGRGLQCAGGRIAPIDDDAAQFAAAVGREFRMCAQMRDINARLQRRLQNGLARLEGNRDLVDDYRGLDPAHASAPICAPASSRPAISRARVSAASRSTAGSKSPRIKRRS